MAIAQNALPDPEVQPTMDIWPDAAEALGISKQTAYEAARRGEIPVIRIGTRVLVLTGPLRKMLGLDGGDDAT